MVFLNKHFRGFYRAPDTGQGGGQATSGDASTGDGTGGQTQAQTQTQGDPNAGGTQVQFSAEQQAHLDKIIGERLTRAREKWEAEQKAVHEKAEAEAEQKRLKEQAEWQKLAEQHESKVAELSPLVEAMTARLGEYEKVITGMLEERVKALGDKAKAAVEALPGGPDALAKLAWLNANAELFATEKGAGLGTPPRGKAAQRQQQHVQSDQQGQQTIYQKPLVQL